MNYDTDFEDGYTDSSLGKIHYMRHHADGKKLIFLHGLGGTTKVWAKLMLSMPDTLDISLIDLLGHGKSAAPEGIRYTISDQVQVLMEFISDQNNGSSCIVGHSYGGWVAAYYSSYPYPSSSLVLVDSAGLKEEEKALVKGDESSKEKFIKQLVMLGNKEYVMRSALSSVREEELTDDVLSAIKKPTMIVWGSNDEVVNVENATLFSQKIKNSTLEVVEGAGHEPHYTHSKEFADILLKFLM